MSIEIKLTGEELESIVFLDMCLKAYEEKMPISYSRLDKEDPKALIGVIEFCHGTLGASLIYTPEQHRIMFMVIEKLKKQ